MQVKLRKILAGIAALAALGLGGAALAGATDGGKSTSGTEQSAPAEANEPAEGQEAENTAADTDDVQDENGKDDASEGEQGEEADAEVSGQDAARAKKAALAETGGGTANTVERDNEKGATYEVEVAKADGSTVDVRLDAAYKVVAVDTDTESGADQQDD